MALRDLYVHFLQFLQLLVITTPTHSPWTSLLLFIARALTVSIVLRTYIIPWCLQLVFQRFRVRSVSLRSMRGIYLRSGRKTWHIERIGLSYHRPSGASVSRWTIKVEGLKLEIAKRSKLTESRPLRPALHRRMPTLADFASSPIAYHLRSVIAAIYAGLQCFRPLVRTCFISILRFLIRCLPTLTQILDLEIHSAVLELAELPQTRISLAEISLSSKVNLTQVESVAFSKVPQQRPLHARHNRYLSVVDWRARLTSNVKRTWEKAWGKTQGTISVTMKFKKLSALQTASRDTTTIIHLPLSEMNASIAINSERGIVPHSLDVDIDLETINISFDLLQNMISSLKAQKNTVQLASNENTFSTLPASFVRSPRSSSIPFMNVFSGTTFPFRQGQYVPRKTLSTAGVHVILPSLKMIKFRVYDVNLSFDPQEGNSESLRLSLHKMTLLAGLSDARDGFHSSILGRSSTRDQLAPDVYMADCSIEMLSLERDSKISSLDTMIVATVGNVRLQSLVTQWPALQIVNSSFMSGDPNAALVALRLKVAHIDVTQDWASIRSLLLRPTSHSPSRNPLTIVPNISPVPRVLLEVDVGPIRVNFPIIGKSGEVAVEMKTNGLILSASTCFISHASKLRSPLEFSSDAFPLSMQTKVVLATAPFELGVRVNPNPGQLLSPTEGITVPLESAFEPMLTIDAIELTAFGTSFALELEDSIVSLDVSSTFLDVHCATEALSIELWHPTVVSTVSTLFDILSQKPSTTKSPDRPDCQKQLPIGLSVTLAIARFTVFVTNRDINPCEDMEISRGLAFHTGISLEYCAILPCHVAAVGDKFLRAETRNKLYLPEERIMDALSRARHTDHLHCTSDLIRISLWDTGLRSAVATAFVADDPYSLEEAEFTEQNREFLFVARTRVDVVYPKTRDEAPDTHGEILVDVPIVRFKLELVHVYSLLLAAQCLKSLSTKGRSRPPFQAANDNARSIPFNFRGTIHTFEVLFNLPTKQSLCTRINNLNLRVLPNLHTILHWDSFVFWVPRPPTKDEDSGENKWEEFCCLKGWNVYLEKDKGIYSVVVKGDTGRLRIPHQFVLSELIRSIILTMKCIHHLMKLVSAAKFSEMPVPGAQGPKNVPTLSIAVHLLSVEAADDPFESKLTLISRAGFRALGIMGTHRDAFDAKVAAIVAAELSSMNETELVDESDGYNFTSRHTVSIEEARKRLLHVHSTTWREVHKAYSQTHNYQGLTKTKTHGSFDTHLTESTFISVSPVPSGPPLIRISMEDLNLRITGPSFPLQSLPDFLHEQGSGEPRDMEYTLLVPLNLALSVASLQANLRDYPIPLLSIRPTSGEDVPSLTFNSDLVVAEEMGTSFSVEWWDCVVVDQDFGIHGASPFSFGVPKTIMPVKTFANAVIHVETHHVTDICWSVSYGPTIQDVMRIVETLSSASRDPSSPIGFWDKLRLVFHWKILASFKGDVHFHMKGSRDPYKILDEGAGFALCWRGHPKIIIGQQNDDKEQIQVISDVMSVTIPNFDQLQENMEPSGSTFDPQSHRKGRSQFNQKDLCELRKTCAKLGSGVRFGIRFDLEKTCSPEDCHKCEGPAHRRNCRSFVFRPHYDVKLELKPKATHHSDSYEGFRSHFIHISISLTSEVRRIRDRDDFPPSSFHLSPKAFSHFWHWWELFDGRLSLPVRQGSLYQQRIISPKFGQHLATIKYRLSIPHLFISHSYIDESHQAWSDGITRFVGAKAFIDHFHADMHQRDQESTRFNPLLGTTEFVRHKPFNAVEVVLKGLDLRAMLATFPDPIKRHVFLEPCAEIDKDRIRTNLPTIDPQSNWMDPDDFVELDWSSTDCPKVNLFRSVACPHFTYFKQSVESDGSDSRGTEYSKFGNEETHICLLGKESTAPQIQIDLVAARIEELRKTLTGNAADHSILKMIGLLENYISHLRQSEAPDKANYYMATDTVSASEWCGFNNVYQVHCPKLFLNETVRDIMITYYYSSRARRGFEYHIAARAVKFIRNQCLLRDQGDESTDDHQFHKGAAGVAHAAVQALRRTLSHDYETTLAIHTPDNPAEDLTLPGLNPLDGWSKDVSLNRSHFCVLLKPQVVLSSETDPDSICVVAAGLAKLQINAIMDDSNVDDPISGRVMNRTYTTLHEVQAFSPTQASLSEDGCVPVEVLIDFRCDSSDFDRLVPQTEATIRYDKFNRLRLRNKVTSAGGSSSKHDHFHLQNETDLLSIHIPQFTVSATDGNFAAISDIVTKLLLFSDAAHKARLDRLETLLFSYDFTDLDSSASVVADLQARLRDAVEQERAARWRLSCLASLGDKAQLEMAKIKVDVLALADELSYVFEAIKLAQDKIDDSNDQKSALLVVATSPDLSWRMLDQERDLLAKLSVKNVKFSWLNRQDSSTVSKLTVGDLHAYDGSVNATWSEVICKFHEPSNHPLVKRNIFALSSWTMLAPVGGITIYENFDIVLHPIRLQLDTKVGQRIMEYIWPARKHRRSGDTNGDGQLNKQKQITDSASAPSIQNANQPSRRSSLELLSGKHRKSLDSNSLSPGPQRRLGASRSYSDLRSAAMSPSSLLIPKNRSTDALSSPPSPSPSEPILPPTPTRKGCLPIGSKESNDAAEMRTRSSQKTFVTVDIASLNLLLSIMKEQSFLCRDARINTRDLHYRNQVWSFEEIVDQFIPSDSSWKGWVKMAFQQPFFEVFPVARELLSKTRRIASKGNTNLELTSSRPVPKQSAKTSAKDELSNVRTSSMPLLSEPEPPNGHDRHDPVGSEMKRPPRQRVLSIFRRKMPHSRPTDESKKLSVA